MAQRFPMGTLVTVSTSSNNLLRVWLVGNREYLINSGSDRRFTGHAVAHRGVARPDVLLDLSSGVQVVRWGARWCSFSSGARTQARAEASGVCGVRRLALAHPQRVQMTRADKARRLRQPGHRRATMHHVHTKAAGKARASSRSEWSSTLRMAIAIAGSNALSPATEPVAGRAIGPRYRLRCSTNAGICWLGCSGAANAARLWCRAHAVMVAAATCAAAIPVAMAVAARSSSPTRWTPSSLTPSSTDSTRRASSPRCVDAPMTTPQWQA